MFFLYLPVTALQRSPLCVCVCVSVCVCVCVCEREKFCVFIISNFIFALDVQYAHVNVTCIMQCQTKSVWEFVFRSAVQRKALHLSHTHTHNHTPSLSHSLSLSQTHTRTLSLCVREIDELRHNAHSLPLFSLKCQKWTLHYMRTHTHTHTRNRMQSHRQRFSRVTEKDLFLSF